jgi:hypothetical protein
MTWRRNRYFAKKVVVDDILFDSIGQSQRYGELKILQAGGKIKNLVCEPAYSIDINGHHICIFSPDFKYTDVTTGQEVVEDFKSPATAKDPVYRLKKKLLRACHGIEVKEVFRTRR